MKIEVVSPRKPSLFLTKQADSVYNDLSEWSNWMSGWSDLDKGGDISDYFTGFAFAYIC